MRHLHFVAALLLSAWTAGCALSDSRAESSPAKQSSQVRNSRRVDGREAERLYRVMAPLLRAMDRPKSPKDVRIGVIDSREINAANAGQGQFYVTTGLLESADEPQLRGIMAHEIAHDDLGHVAKLQILGAGLNLGVIFLEELIPGSSSITPLAGDLIARGYSRSDELAADRHGVDLLARAGYPKQVMIDALSWVARASRSSGGGFLSTHPGTAERINALSRLR